MPAYLPCSGSISRRTPSLTLASAAGASRPVRGDEAFGWLVPPTVRQEGGKPMRNMRALFVGGVFVLEVVLPAWTQGVVFNCPPDAVKVGLTCVDKYEASVWLTTDVALIEKIRA